MHCSIYFITSFLFLFRSPKSPRKNDELNSTSRPIPILSQSSPTRKERSPEKILTSSDPEAMSIGSGDGIADHKRASSQGRIRVGSAASKKKRIVVTDGKTQPVSDKFRSSSPKQNDKVLKQFSGDFTPPGK